RLPEKKLDGVDLMPYLRDGKGVPPHEVLFWRTGGGVAYAVWAGDYKLDEPARAEKMLFNVTQDVAERSDVASAEPERVARMEKLREQWNGELVEPVFSGPAPDGKGKKKGKVSPD